MYEEVHLLSCTLLLGVFTTLNQHATLICCVNMQNTFPDKKACWVKVGNKPKKKVLYSK